MTDPAAPEVLPHMAHDHMLSLLARIDPERLKPFAEGLIAGCGDIEVKKSQTGLVMLPMRDTAQGTAFHLGEVLVAEAQLHAGGQEGYGMRRGRDLEAATAMAVVDLAVALGVAHSEISGFLDGEEAHLSAQDNARMREVEATRVNMETF